MSHDIVDRMPQTCLIPSHESDLQVVHGLAAELRCIAHDHARDDGFVKFSGTRWLAYYHSLDRILMEHDRRQAEIYKASDEIERLRRDYSCICNEMRRMMDERDEARRKCCEALADAYEQSLNDDDGGFFGGEDEKWTPQRFAKDEGWDCYKENNND